MEKIALCNDSISNIQNFEITSAKKQQNEIVSQRIKNKTWQSRIYAENPRDTAVFRG